MYLHFVNDRKLLSYKILKYKNNGIQLILITNQAVTVIRNFSLNINGKTTRIVVVFSLATIVWFINLESVSAIGLPMSFAPVEKV